MTLRFLLSPGPLSFICKFSLVDLGSQSQHCDGGDEEAGNKFEEKVEDTAIVERWSKRELKIINNSTATQQLGSAQLEA
jgi:hypothetical protein